MIGSTGTPVQRRDNGRRARVISKPGWVGVSSTMIRYLNGDEEEVPDGDLVIANDNAVVMMKCPTCKRGTPHYTRGAERDERGVFQWHDCAECGTATKVYGGQAGETFQENVRHPDGMG